MDICFVYPINSVVDAYKCCVVVVEMGRGRKCKIELLIWYLIIDRMLITAIHILGHGGTTS